MNKAEELMNTISSNDLVSVFDGTVTATSLKISEKFDKRHDNVLRDIDNLRSALEHVGDHKAQALKIEELEIIRQNALGKVSTHRYFALDRNAFSILVMGFTGKKALTFKLAFLEAFNAMEAELAKQAQAKLIDPNDVEAVFNALAAKLGQRALVMPELPTPKIQSKINSNTFTAVCGTIGLRPRILLNHLETEGLVVRRQNANGFIPVGNGRAYFRRKAQALYVKDAGLIYLNRRGTKGDFPINCYDEHYIRPNFTRKQTPNRAKSKAKVITPVRAYQAELNFS